MRVLLIDDDLSMEKLLRRLLRQAGMAKTEFTCARSVEKAREHLSADAFDLVLVDNVVPPYSKAEEYAPGLRDEYACPQVVLLSGLVPEQKPAWANEIWDKGEISQDFIRDRLAALAS